MSDQNSLSPIEWHPQLQGTLTQLASVLVAAIGSAPNPADLRGAADLPMPMLLQKLEHFGGALHYLHSQHSQLLAEGKALKMAVDMAEEIARSIVMMDVPKSSSEASKLQLALRSEHGAQLIAARRALALTEAHQLFVKGWIDSYQIAWETTSRILTGRTGEAELAGRR